MTEETIKRIKEHMKLKEMAMLRRKDKRLHKVI